MLKLPAGCSTPEAFTSSTDKDRVPSTISSGGIPGKASTYVSDQTIRNVIEVAVPVELFATLHRLSIL